MPRRFAGILGMRLWGLGRWAGESSRREDPAPTGGIAGSALRGMPPTGVYAHVGLHGEGVEGDDDAARCVATSFEKRENRF